VDDDASWVREFGAELTKHEWADLVRHGHPRRRPAGTPLFIEGTRSEVVVILISGRVKVKALGAATALETEEWSAERSPKLPEPLASVVNYLGNDLSQHGREFVPTAGLTDELDMEPSLFARQMSELGCRPTRHYVPTEDGATRRVRGYLTADIRAAIDRAATDQTGSGTATETD
jgi:DNA segregation ATPase FtsK/SpoIIIE, S-DNA-T family